MDKVRIRFSLYFAKVAIMNRNIILRGLNDYDVVSGIKVSDILVSVVDIAELLKSQITDDCFSFYS